MATWASNTQANGSASTRASCARRPCSSAFESSWSRARSAGAERALPAALNADTRAAVPIEVGDDGWPCYLRSRVELDRVHAVDLFDPELMRDPHDDELG